jgi:hypothetical protein
MKGGSELIEQMTGLRSSVEKDLKSKPSFDSWVHHLTAMKCLGLASDFISWNFIFLMCEMY